MRNADKRSAVPPHALPLALSNSRQLHPAADPEIRRLLRENKKLRRRLAELSREKTRLEALVEVDALTGVLNRRGLDRFLTQAVAHARRYHHFPAERGICVLLLDLDGLKAVNDLTGHATGDAVLTDAARRIGQLIRPDDAIGRLGGDEFVIVLWNISQTDVVAKIELFDDEIVEIAERHHVSGALLGASIGLAWLDPQDDPRAVIERADEAMYAVKRARRAARASIGCEGGSIVEMNDR